MTLRTPTLAVEKRLANFVEWALQEGPWEGCDLDGGSVQDKALALGLIKRTKYDPAIHGEDTNFDAEPGDDWFVLSDDVATLAKASPHEQRYEPRVRDVNEESP